MFSSPQVFLQPQQPSNVSPPGTGSSHSSRDSHPNTTTSTDSGFADSADEDGLNDSGKVELEVVVVVVRNSWNAAIRITYSRSRIEGNSMEASHSLFCQIHKNTSCSFKLTTKPATKDSHVLQSWMGMATRDSTARLSSNARGAVSTSLATTRTNTST